MSVGVSTSATRKLPSFRTVFTVIRKLALLGVVGYFFPFNLAFYGCCGLLDVLRNKRRTWATFERYFTGNGIFTWLLSPFNLCMDLICLPFWNKGIYQITDLPKPYQDEINAVIQDALNSNLVAKLEAKLDGQKRGMVFFKWYGKNLASSVEIPEFHRTYKYIRTIGVSVFNKKQSTTKHFGPLRVTLRVLYNINDMHDKNAFITVGNQTNHWQDNKLFIFDDTLQHQSCNETDAVRYCMFIDILRPSLFPWLNSAILTGIRYLIAPFNFIFYKHWSFIK